MAHLEGFTMYAKDRQAVAPLVSLKVQGNDGPDIDRKVRRDLINLRTFHMEYDICSRKGRLPAIFARGFGLEVAPFVMLRDPNKNEIEVAVKKRNGKVYFTDGWEFLKTYYNILAGSWITVVYANRYLFVIEIRTMYGEEILYPQSTPPQRWLLPNQGAITYRHPLIPYGPADLFLPTSFYHLIVKELTSSDVTGGMLKLSWLGFCQYAFPAERTELTIIDYLGCTWKLLMDFCQDENLSCVFSGEWQALCHARKLIEGMKIKLGVTQANNNKTVYLCAPPMFVLQTRMPTSASNGEIELEYQIEQYLWKD